MDEWTQALSFKHPRVDKVDSDLSYNMRFDLNTRDRFFRTSSQLWHPYLLIDFTISKPSFLFKCWKF